MSNAMTVANALILVGLCLDMIGALLLANSFLSATSIRQTPLVLMRAVFSIGSASFSANLSKAINEENAGIALRGVAYLMLGFISQVGGLVTGVLHTAG